MGHRNYVFTLNNPTEDEDTHLQTTCADSDVIKYAIWQLECGEGGTRHLQGYLEFTRPLRIVGVKRLFGNDRLHLESRRGSRDQARDYCRKDDTYVPGGVRFEFGEFQQQRGRRTDIEQFRDSIAAGESDEQLFMEQPGMFLRYGQMVQRCRYAVHKRARREVSVIVCHGVTGAGKSHFAWHYRDNDMQQVYKLFQKKPVWFDGYRGEPVLFIDEWEGDPSCCLLKEICDVWPQQGPVKGSSVIAQWDTVIIATNWPRIMLDQSWDDAMRRRVTQWREYRGRGDVTVTEVA